MIHIVNSKNQEVKLRQLRSTYEWFFQKLVAMGALSVQEQDSESAFLNPMANHLANSMRAIIKQKVHSALCNEDSVDQFNKAMFEGKRVKYDKHMEELVTVEDPRYAQRTQHNDIPPATSRIQQYKHKTFGNKYKDAVEAVKTKDHSLSVMKKQKNEHGLMTAQLGSIYDVPMTAATSESMQMQSTHAGSVRFSETTGVFSQSEGATFKPAFKTFYTNSEQPVKYTTINKFEGKSSYFSYYPTNELYEQKLEQVWFHH